MYAITSTFDRFGSALPQDLLYGQGDFWNEVLDIPQYNFFGFVASHIVAKLKRCRQLAVQGCIEYTLGSFLVLGWGRSIMESCLAGKGGSETN